MAQPAANGVQPAARGVPPAANGVLIVTSKFDPHADSVIPLLRARGCGVFRLNTDDFHADITLAATGDGAWDIADRWGHRLAFPAGARSAWWRKPVDPAPPAAIGDPGGRALVVEETREVIDALAADHRVRWVNNPHDNARARRKLPQLRHARTLGLRVPRSIVTNDPARARAFQAEIGGPVLCKALKAVGFATGDDHASLFSRLVPPADFDANAAAVAHCPTLFQEYIAKDHELRVTIIGDAAFCCRIDSQAVEAARIDWRRADPARVPHRMVALDPAVERALRAMLAAYNLAFGAFDLIVPPAGEPVFLELNPNGQWLWVERATGAKLSEAMAALLAG